MLMNQSLQPTQNPFAPITDKVSVIFVVTDFFEADIFYWQILIMDLDHETGSYTDPRKDYFELSKYFKVTNFLKQKFLFADND
jgi:hypothetical protein